MRSIRKFDWGLALALLLAVLAAWPFALRPSLPRETDTELHVFRAAELGYALRAGTLYPRWAPDFYFGYGYPIFNYYAPLTYYLANLFSLALPGGAVFGVKAVFILGFLGAGVGTYGLVRRLADERAGMLAAAVYLFAPYVYYIDPHARGDLAEFFALAVAPCGLWAIESLRQEPRRSHLALAIASVAALILTHNLMALVFFALIVGYLCWQALLDRRSVGLPALAAVLGVALAAFFWLPVALERNAVQLGNLIGPGHFDFRNHFLTLGEMLSPSLPIDLGAVNPAYRFNLGLVQWTLALLGMATRWRGTHHIRFWALAGAILIFLMLPISTPVWETIPLMAFLQFPWRLLGPAALCLAILAGQVATLVDRGPHKVRPFIYTGLLVLPLVAGLPLFVPPSWGDFGPTDQLAMLDFELSGLALGTTSTGDYVPIEVDVVPGPRPEMIESYLAGGLVDKVNRHTLPEGATVEVLNHRPTLDEFATSSPEDFTLRLYTFMFAGWRASIDGQAASIEVAKPEGFITVRVPAGEHTVRVWLGSTPARDMSWTISGLALMLSVLAVWRVQPQATPEASPGHATFPAVHSLIALAAFTALAMLASGLGWFQHHSEGVTVETAQYPLLTHLQGGIDLLGYDILATQARPGQEVIIVLYWKARESVSDNYQVFVHLLTESPHTWGQSDTLNPGDYPTTRWPLDRYIRDSHTFTIPLGSPPGEYTLSVGLWNRDTGYRQLVVEPDGTILGDAITLPTPITVLPARHQPAPEALPLDVQTTQTLADGVTLLGATLHPGEHFDAEMGYLTVILYWRAERADLPDNDVRVRLVNEDSQILATREGPPVDGRYPMSAWGTGEVVRDLHSFWLDSATPDGQYTVEISLGAGDWTPIIGFERILPAQ